jgi:hypothetical protein
VDSADHGRPIRELRRLEVARRQERIVNGIAWLGLWLELWHWRRLGHTPGMWWRDDDARAPSEALDRLLVIAAGRPLTLAIVPDGDLAALAGRLASARSVSVSQHGVDHINRSEPGEAASEYPAGTAPAEVASRISAARAAMTAAGLATSLYTPTWNRIDATLAEAIPLAGFRALSAARAAPAVNGVKRIDADLDVLRWKGRVRFRGRRRILGSLTRQLRQRRAAGDFDSPIGLLTHHLAHDEAAWAFLTWFTSFADSRFAWRGFDHETTIAAD